VAHNGETELSGAPVTQRKTGLIGLSSSRSFTNRFAFHKRSILLIRDNARFG
jgi:hypothetical protein